MNRLNLRQVSADLRRAADWELLGDEERQRLEDVELTQQDAVLDTEKRVETLIRSAFKRIGLEIAPDQFPVKYDGNTREAIVTIDYSTADGVPLEKLVALTSTGLADQYTVGSHGSMTLEITFTVAPGIGDSP